MPDQLTVDVPSDSDTTALRLYRNGAGTHEEEITLSSLSASPGDTVQITPSAAINDGDAFTVTAIDGDDNESSASSSLTEAIAPSIASWVVSDDGGGDVTGVLTLEDENTSAFPSGEATITGNTVDGQTPTVTDNSDGTWTIAWTGLTTGDAYDFTATVDNNALTSALTSTQNVTAAAAPAFEVSTIVHDWDLDDDLGSGITSGSLANDVGSPTLDVNSGTVNSLATHVEMLASSRLRSSANLSASGVDLQVDFDVRFPGSVPTSKVGLIELNPLVIAFAPAFDPDAIEVEGFGSNAAFVFASAPAADTWYSVSIRYDSAGETLYGYIDGVESGQVDKTGEGAFSSSDRAYIAGFSGAAEAFDIRNIIFRWE